MSVEAGQGMGDVGDRFSPAELAAFQRDGFFIVRGLADERTIDAMRRATDRAVEEAAPPIEYESEVGYPGAPTSASAAGGRTIRRLKCAVARGPVFLDFATSPQVVERMRQLLGPALVLPLAHHNCIMLKDPNFSSDTGWHQDFRYWRFSRPELVNVQLILDPATPVTGALHFLPGTHSVQIRREQLDDASFLKVDDPEAAEWLKGVVQPRLDPGDAVFFHCLTFHAATRNRSNNYTRSLILSYRPADNPPLPGTRSAAMPELWLPTPDAPVNSR
ncbi:MAG: phytanoyl-CoA dioxygenase family protein [Planctomycetia bacterium]